MEYQNLSTVRPFDKLQILEVGKEKSGKSWLARTAPKPVLFLDYDLRANALAGMKDVYSITFRDPAPHIQPTAFNEVLDVLTQIEDNGSLLTLNAKWPAEQVKTIVVDGIQTMARAAMRMALYSNSDLRRRLTFGGKWTVDVTKNFDGWNAEMSTVESIILRCLALPMHFIATSHQMEEESETSSLDKKVFTGKIGIFPARYNLLLKYFNEVWHLENSPDPSNPSSPIYLPRVQVRPDYRCPWATTNLMLDQYEGPDIEAMIKKHLSRAPSQTTQSSVVKP